MASSTDAALIGVGAGLATIAIGPQLVSGAGSAWSWGGSALDSVAGFIGDQAGGLGDFFGDQLADANLGIWGDGKKPPAAPAPQAPSAPPAPVSGTTVAFDPNLKTLAPDSGWPSWLTWVLVALGVGLVAFLIWKAIG